MQDSVQQETWTQTPLMAISNIRWGYGGYAPQKNLGRAAKSLTKRPPIKRLYRKPLPPVPPQNPGGKLISPPIGPIKDSNVNVGTSRTHKNQGFEFFSPPNASQSVLGRDILPREEFINSNSTQGERGFIPQDHNIKVLDSQTPVNEKKHSSKWEDMLREKIFKASHKINSNVKDPTFIAYITFKLNNNEEYIFDYAA